MNEWEKCVFLTKNDILKLKIDIGVFVFVLYILCTRYEGKKI